jgi:signal transduction histidine kinase
MSPGTSHEALRQEASLTDHPSAAAFLSGGGEMAALMRSHDWEKTSLGAPVTWPQSLRTALNIVLTSRYAMWMGWGETMSFLYNDAYRPTLGLKHPWALGTPAREVWAEIWNEVGPRVRSVLSTGEATYDEGLLLFLQRSGFPEETYHTFSYSPLADDAGRVSGMLCVVTEETERVISERRMATLRDFASGLASANTASEVLGAIDQLDRNDRDLPFTLAYLYDEQGAARLARATRLAAGHPAAPTLIQPGGNVPWPAGALYGQPEPLVVDNLPDALPSGAWDKPPVRAAVVPFKQQGHDEPAGFLVVGLNPYRRYDEAYSGFVDLVAGQLAAGLANARAYEEERRRAEALAELDRAKTAFFSNVSHEFRTPLTLMLGPVEDLLASEGVPAESRESLSVIHRSGLRLQRLVNNLLDFSRIEAGRALASYQPMDLSAFTAELASTFRSAMDRAGLEYRVECGRLSQPVYIDTEMWEKVVYNLISNAFKYTLEGSVSVTVEERDGRATLSVSDTGGGIPEEALPRLFERFHRVEQTRGRTHEGTGIGLALVQELVLLHGGSVSVKSAVGRGSTFTVSLPYGSTHLPQDRLRAERPVSSTALHADSYIQEALRWLPGSESETQTPTGASRVLVADDNADMRDYVRRLLQQDYEVIPTANGELALAAAIADPPDLVLSDLMMPVLDGFGLLKGLREHPSTRNVPFILLSARAGEEARVEGLQSGADDYLVKPFSARELRARVASHLALRRERQVAIEQLNQIFRQAPVGIIVMRGRDLVVELANPTSLAMLEGRDVIGRPFAEVVPEAGPELWAALNSVLDTGEPFVRNDFYVSYDQDGDGVAEDHWFNVVYHPLKDRGEAVAGLITVVIDVTRQMRARQELERANRELEEFAYVSSHDLQEPLRMVNIYSELLLQRTPLEDDEAKSYADFVRQGVRRMEGLIKDLLIYSRVVHPEQEQGGPVELDEALDEALGVLRMRIEETGASVVVRSLLPQVMGEKRQLALVFQNLLSNALKYTRVGVAPRVEVSAEEYDGGWMVQLKDNGIGFDPQYAERIFGLFKRLHNDSYPGTGLGLAICQRIIERYQGRIWASSAGDGQGATFAFTLRKPPRWVNVAEE